MSVQEYAVSASDTAEAAKVDFNFLGALCLAEQFLFLFPNFYIVLFKLLTEFKSRFEYFAIGIPRGFAKTTFVKILCVWYVLFSSRKFILIISASEKKAVAILADVCDMLSSPNIRRIFGHWDANIEEDNQVTKVFHFRGREIILWAAGAGTSVRGVNRKNSRPDVMVMDDIQDREDAKNKELADSLTTWMLSTLMMAKSPFGCTFIFIGNMYPQNSILAKLKQNKQWTSFIVGGILADGTSLWEELKPIEDLLEEYESVASMGHPEVFISEVLNSTEIALASGIDPAKIAFLPEYLAGEEQGEGSFILIDPSSGKKKGDACTIGHFEVKDTMPIFDELASGQFTPIDTIRTAVEMGFRRNTRLIGVEDVAYQSTLLFWFEKYCSTAELNGVGVITGFQFVPLPPKGQAKNTRIKNGFLKLCPNKEGRVEIYLHPRVRSLIVTQYVEWNPLKTDNVDDMIDLVGYVDYVMQNHDTEIIRDIFDTSDRDRISATQSQDIEMPF